MVTTIEQEALDLALWSHSELSWVSTPPPAEPSFP